MLPIRETVVATGQAGNSSFVFIKAPHTLFSSNIKSECYTRIIMQHAIKINGQNGKFLQTTPWKIHRLPFCDYVIKRCVLVFRIGSDIMNITESMTAPEYKYGGNQQWHFPICLDGRTRHLLFPVVQPAEHRTSRKKSPLPAALLAAQLTNRLRLPLPAVPPAVLVTSLPKHLRLAVQPINRLKLPPLAVLPAVRPTSNFNRPITNAWWIGTRSGCRFIRHLRTISVHRILRYKPKGDHAL